MKKKYYILGCIFIVAAIILGIFCGLIAKSGGDPLAMDVWARDFAYSIRGNKGGFLYWFNRILTETGDIYFIGVVCVVFLILTRLDRRWVWFFVGLLLQVGLNAVFKGIFQRERPYQEFWWMYESSKSFPSGHSTSAGMMYAFLFYVFFMLKDHKKLRIVGCCLSAFWILLIPVTRIMLGMHYLSDCIAGVMLGLCCGVISMILCEVFLDYHILCEGVIPFKRKKNE